MADCDSGVSFFVLTAGKYMVVIASDMRSPSTSKVCNRCVGCECCTKHLLMQTVTQLRAVCLCVLLSVPWVCPKLVLQVPLPSLMLATVLDLVHIKVRMHSTHMHGKQ